MSLKFDDLPDELILSILSVLDYKDVCRVARVSKKFNSLGKDNSLWYACTMTAHLFLTLCHKGIGFMYGAGDSLPICLDLSSCARWRELNLCL
jgi:hypothetical protein